MWECELVLVNSQAAVAEYSCKQFGAACLRRVGGITVIKTRENESVNISSKSVEDDEDNSDFYILF